MNQPAAPRALHSIQKWFGGVLRQPIDIESRINAVAPSKRTIVDEAGDYIVPSPTLQPWQRIQIYNQQYWWRLLNTLHDIYPLVTRLFGYVDFNQRLAIPYLVKYAPEDWSLNLLGERLPRWLAANYHDADRDFVRDAAALDFAYNDTFFAPHKTPIQMADGAEIEALLNISLTLQPHVHLFALPYAMFPFRREMLEQTPDYWVDNDFPELIKDRTYYYLFFRSVKNEHVTQEINLSQYAFLKLLQKGTTLSEACDWLETQEEAIQNEAAEHLNTWLQKWVVAQLLIRS